MNIHNTLTNRELEILKLTAKGKTKEEIAAILCITIHTVKAHLESIYLKLNAHNKVQAIVSALKNNILKLDNI